MKKLFVLFAILAFLAGSVYAADQSGLATAELAAQPRGRNVTFDQPQLLNIWHTGSTVGAFGVSSVTALFFYEDTVAITTARFGGYASIDTSVATGDTVDEVVSLINSDTSGLWKASRGRDATPGTCTHNLITAAYAASGTSETVPSTLLIDTSVTHRLQAGFAADSNVTYRLKRIEESVQGTGTHLISVWDGSTKVYQRAYSLAVYVGGAYGINGVTPLTIEFAGKGLAATGGNGLVVCSEWTTTMAGDTAITENLAIVVDDLRY